MREWIALATNLSEQIVHKDRFVGQHNTKKTVVAINPTRAEWEANFPKGAGGVLLKDGRIVVGDGDCLDHSAILDFAGIDYREELCRLQIWKTWAHIELWIDDEYFGEDDRAKVVHAMEQKLGMTMAELEALAKKALSRFMGDIPLKGIPKTSMDGSVAFPEDEEWLDHHIANHA